jgi:hypothetical protein
MPTLCSRPERSACRGVGYLNRAQQAAAVLRRPLAERPAGGLGEVGGQRPADVAAALALTGVEALASLALHGAEAPTAEALDGVLLSHPPSVGEGRGPRCPRKGDFPRGVRPRCPGSPRPTRAKRARWQGKGCQSRLTRLSTTGSDPGVQKAQANRSSTWAGPFRRGCARWRCSRRWRPRRSRPR